MQTFRKLGKGVLLLPGSPTTILVPSDDGYYVIDPGSKRNRSGLLSSKRIKGILITHCHSDHVLAAAYIKDGGEGVYAPAVESCSIKHTGLRSFTTFGGVPPKTSLLFEVVGVEVNHQFDPPFEIGTLEALPLPGHTYGQVGYSGKGFLYAADSLFGDRLLKRVVIPYHQDHGEALKTLHMLRERYREFKKIVPSHGPVVEGGKARELIDLNIKHLKKLERKILDLLSRDLTVEELTLRIIREGGGKPTPRSLLLGSITLKSILSSLHSDGKVEPRISDKGIAWSRSR